MRTSQHGCRRLLEVALLLMVGTVARPAAARPEAPGIFCDTYPDAAECLGRVVSCNQCHTTTFPAAWNPYGLDLLGQLASAEGEFGAALPAALRAVDGMDSDDDGVSNGEEIAGGTLPGDASSGWVPPSDPQGPPNPRYDVGHYDFAFAAKRVSVLYCGRSPSYEAMQAFRDTDTEPEAVREQLHDMLSECLDSAYWRDEGLPRLADKRIRPLKVAGPDSEVRIGPVRVVLGDYFYDYRLWSYVLTGDRDARELLLADYHVQADGSGQLKKVQGVLEQPDPMALGGGQPLAPEQRAGLLTTQWFLGINTMFSEVPRTTAAQAYRAFMGADISRYQGIQPVPGEPSDVDNKGVDEPRCASCHSTLDPLAYAFAKFDGINQYDGLSVGTYNPSRPSDLLPAWSDAEQVPVIMGEEVETVRQWAEVAVRSDAFKRNLAQLFFEHALGRGPNPDEVEAFTAMWRALPEDGYSANRLVHRLVDTEAFGVP